MGALAPVLTPTEAGERRCVTVFFEPIGHAPGRPARRRRNRCPPTWRTPLRAAAGSRIRRPAPPRRRPGRRARTPGWPTAAPWSGSPSRPRSPCRHLVDHRRRPPAGAGDHRRGFHPAAAGPGPGLRVRRRRHPARHRAAPPRGAPMSRPTRPRPGDGRPAWRRLVADFGHRLPPLTPPPAPRRRPRPVHRAVGRHGRRRPRRAAGRRCRRRWRSIG